jgi:hypothetical protein
MNQRVENELRDILDNLTQLGLIENDLIIDCLRKEGIEVPRPKLIHFAGLLGLVFVGLGYYGFFHAGVRAVVKQEESNKTVVWFDRQRQHIDGGFQKLDRKFPAQYEVWSGDTLIERWHWRVEHDPRTDIFGRWIHRCVANRNEAGKYTGHTQYIMDSYPKGKGLAQNHSPKPNSLVFEVNSIEHSLSLWTLNSNSIEEGCRVKWCNGKLKYAVTVSPMQDPVNLHKDLSLRERFQYENGGQYDESHLQWLANNFRFVNQVTDPPTPPLAMQ